MRKRSPSVTSVISISSAEDEEEPVKVKHPRIQVKREPSESAISIAYDSEPERLPRANEETTNTASSATDSFAPLTARLRPAPTPVRRVAEATATNSHTVSTAGGPTSTTAPRPRPRPRPIRRGAAEAARQSARPTYSPLPPPSARPSSASLADTPKSVLPLDNADDDSVPLDNGNNSCSPPPRARESSLESSNKENHGPVPSRRVDPRRVCSSGYVHAHPIFWRRPRAYPSGEEPVDDDELPELGEVSEPEAESYTPVTKRQRGGSLSASETAARPLTKRARNVVSPAADDLPPRVKDAAEVDDRRAEPVSLVQARSVIAGGRNMRQTLRTPRHVTPEVSDEDEHGDSDASAPQVEADCVEDGDVAEDHSEGGYESATSVSSIDHDVMQAEMLSAGARVVVDEPLSTHDATRDIASIMSWVLTVFVWTMVSFLKHAVR